MNKYNEALEYYNRSLEINRNIYKSDENECIASADTEARSVVVIPLRTDPNSEIELLLE